MTIEILENNQEFGYMLFKSNYIAGNLDEILQHTDVLAKTLQQKLQSASSNVTWLYKEYNVFAYASGSSAYFSIYRDLIKCIEVFCDEHQVPTHNLWMRNWLNFHDYNEVLELHGHDVMHHGYVSIEPQSTETIFVDGHGIEQYKIINKPGQIYLGPGRRNHYVKNLQPYSNKRITLGLDLENTIVPGINLGCMPVIV
jgi:hypothetical protein